MKNRSESKALREVREWKEVCLKEVTGLERAAAVRRRLTDSAKKAQELGFFPPQRDKAKVAENQGKYSSDEHE